ncbi:MAG TPA: ADP-dependent glucokinase/phosphofructokinase [archaeon]|jgi:ADP-dependent phosphofructokinase/glucokinase|nr:ADP-dependent glucokinase/phosphofructokinase [archaeon]
MKPFLGLFAHWDVIARQEPPEFLAKFFSRKGDSEIFISKKLHSRILSSLTNPERIIGGNAANAAATLSDIGIASVLSCPSRPKNLMSELSRHKIFVMSKRREKSPISCSRPDEEAEHIIFEKEGYRKIFNYDMVQLDFLLDEDFWDSVKNASYLFLSGFHAVPRKHRKKVNEIADMLEDRKFKVHLELGYGKGLMKYSIKKLLDTNCLDSIGMNETELGILGINEKEPKETAEGILSFLEKTGLERISLHTRDYRLTAFRGSLERNLKAAELSVQVCTAKALGGIKDNLGKAKAVSLSRIQTVRSKNFFIIPTRIVENPRIIVGLGDAAAVTDSFYAMKA